MKVRISAGLAITAMSAVILVGVATQPAEATAPRDVHVYNLCGNSCSTGGGSGGLAKVDVVLNQVSTGTFPTLLHLVEMCENQYIYLRDRLFMTGTFLTTKVSTACGKYGIAVFGGGSYINRQLYEYTAQDATNDTGTQDDLNIFNRCNVHQSECRRLICTQYSGPAGLFTGCTTHLAAGGSSTTRSQASDSDIYARTSFVGNKVIAGDYNLVPLDSGMNQLYANWQEAEGNSYRAFCSASWKCPTFDDGRKIDYMFGSPSARGVGINQIDTISDHKYLRVSPAVDW